VKASYVIAVGALLAASASGAKDQAQNGDPAKAEKMICQTERVTGSLARSQKICMTAAQWNEMRLNTKHDMDDIARSAGAIAPAGNGANGGPSGLAR